MTIRPNPLSLQPVVVNGPAEFLARAGPSFLHASHRLRKNLTTCLRFKYDSTVACPAHAYGAPVILDPSRCCLCAGLVQAQRDRARFGPSFAVHRRRRGRPSKSDPLPVKPPTDAAEESFDDVEFGPVYSEEVAEVERIVQMRGRYE